MHSRRRALRNCPPFKYTLWIPVLERSTPWRYCDCSTRSMGYEVSSMKAGLHFSENLWQHKLLTNSFLLCRRKSRAECLARHGLPSYKERSLCRNVLPGFNCSASSKAQTTCICGTSAQDRFQQDEFRQVWSLPQSLHDNASFVMKIVEVGCASGQILES
jgi:hypothetical protein